MAYSQFLADERATLAFGAQCAKLFRAPATVYLQGDLGAGKTTFVRGLLQGFGYDGTVKSPTYAVVESYRLPEIDVNHFDLYRFASPEEWQDAGLNELFDERSLCLIEWANQGGEFVPAAQWCLSLERENEGRRATLSAHNPQQQQELTTWQS
ncbi:tRNA (adenosine(37)-N6)-threonylcarbamoyltransferase complex ATPase subunit type 1 TsaE [Neisseriaceae bacterium B1]